MKIIHFVLHLILTLHVAVLAVGQTVPKLSLHQILDSIALSYPELQKYSERVNALTAKAEGERSQMPPQLGVGVNRFPYNSSMLMDKDSPMNQAGIMLSAEQMLVNPYKLNRKREYTLSLAHIEEANAAWAMNILFADAKILYYQRMVLEKNLSVLQENETVLKTLIRTSKEKYTVNQADLGSIFKAEAKLSELLNMRAMLESRIAESNIGLSALINKPPHFRFAVDTLANIPEISINEGSIEARSDIASMEKSIKSMGLNLAYMSSQKYPDFGVRAEHMQMFGMPNQYSIMAMVTLPIAPWSSKMYKGEVKAMQYEISAMQKEKETMILMATKMLNEKRTMLQYTRQQLENYQRTILPSYEMNFESNWLSYKQNISSLFVLLDAWEMLLMKRMDFYETYFELLKLEAQIEFELEKR